MKIEALLSLSVNFKSLATLTGSKKEIIEAMAKALFVSAWADKEEEEGRTHNDQGYMDISPATTPEAFWKARELASLIESVNGMSLEALYEKAASTEGKHYKEPTSKDFGHYLTMQALGHGVSWFNDHPQFDLKIPHIEFYLNSGHTVN